MTVGAQTATGDAARLRFATAGTRSLQRARIISAVAGLVAEHGYGGTSPGAIIDRAAVSRTTFYSHFESRDACFLAAFDHALAALGEVAAAAYDKPGQWCERVRAALQAALWFLEDEPALGSVVFAETAGPTRPAVIGRRAQALAAVTAVVEEGRREVSPAKEPLPLTAEGVVGGVLAVIHTRLGQRRPGQLIALTSPLMSIIVLPYFGPAAARRELKRPVPKRAAPPKPTTTLERTNGRLADLDMRPTYRTLMVLTAIGQQPGACSRDVAEAAGITDAGQISKLLARLERLKLVRTSARRVGERHEWCLTAHGKDVERAMSADLSLGERSQLGVARA
jgi:AcrR family transcriptional regulator/DNA-binding MarR family transcriptional regulator